MAAQYYHIDAVCMRPPFCNFAKFYGRRLGIFSDNDTNPHLVSGPFLWTSGVQRLLDARSQRGSWMPSKIFSIHPAKFQTTFFYQLSNFRTIRSLDTPSRAASCPGNNIFLFIFCHLPTFFLHKTGPLDAPQGGCPGPSHRPHPLDLHATGEGLVLVPTMMV